MAIIKVELGPGIHESEVIATLGERFTDRWVYVSKNKYDGTTLVEIVKYERVPSVEITDQATLRALRAFATPGESLQDTLRKLMVQNEVEI